MDKFLQRYNLPRLNQEEIENMNRLITSNEIETVIKNLPTNKSPGPDSFTGESYQTFREELTPILSNSSKKLQRKEHSQPHSTITLIPKADKDTTKKKRKLQTTIADEYRCKNLQQILANRIQQHIKRIIHYDQVGFIPGIQGFFNIWKSINVIHHINRLKNKNI